MKQDKSMKVLYAEALIFKLYKAKVISREVYERALVKCKERLSES